MEPDVLLTLVSRLLNYLCLVIWLTLILAFYQKSGFHARAYAFVWCLFFYVYVPSGKGLFLSTVALTLFQSHRCTTLLLPKLLCFSFSF